ncbi:hypothetical protein FN924_10605 [Radiobacillus deserti]|uniref:Competence protein ComG n=2 Tax=Radiobacillus deserti TaxID=2594883 RepID=A0A516KGS0_9BACI|nr:hypothetical protein FN924_10605 [Radiobacillus deserti]
MSFVIIILLGLLSSLTIYQNHLHSTLYLERRLQVESLFQLGLTTFKDEYQGLNEDAGSRFYVFPDGSVTIKYENLSDNKMKLTILVKTPESSSPYRTQKIIPISSP